MLNRTGSPRIAAGIAGLAAIAGLVMSPNGPADAQAQQPSLEGSWSGGGTVTFPSGGTESARCRASFRRQTTTTFSMNAICATPSGRVSQTAQIERLTATRFSGEFYNTEYGVGGSISITLRGNSLSASLNGGGASASFSLSK